MKTLYSKNLKIRPLQVGDKNSVHEFLGDFENSKYLLGATSSIEETESFINKAIKRSKDIPISEYHYAVVLRENNKLIGSCSLEVDIPFNEAELGWMLNKRFWSNGYGTQIARALMKFGFEDLDLHRLYAVCDSRNTASYKLMEKCGMRKEGHFIKSRFFRGEYHDELFYAVLKEEWLDIK